MFRPKACNFIKKETLVQVFPCEFCKISKNFFSYRTPPVAASARKHLIQRLPFNENILELIMVLFMNKEIRKKCFFEKDKIKE